MKRIIKFLIKTIIVALGTTFGLLGSWVWFSFIAFKSLPVQTSATHLSFLRPLFIRLENYWIFSGMAYAHDITISLYLLMFLSLALIISSVRNGIPIISFFILILHDCFEILFLRKMGLRGHGDIDYQLVFPYMATFLIFGALFILARRSQLKNKYLIVLGKIRDILTKTLSNKLDSSIRSIEKSISDKIEPISQIPRQMNEIKTAITEMDSDQLMESKINRAKFPKVKSWNDVYLGLDSRYDDPNIDHAFTMSIRILDSKRQTVTYEDFGFNKKEPGPLILLFRFITDEKISKYDNIFINSKGKNNAKEMIFKLRQLLQEAFNTKDNPITLDGDYYRRRFNKDFFDIDPEKLEDEIDHTNHNPED